MSWHQFSFLAVFYSISSFLTEEHRFRSEFGGTLGIITQMSLVSGKVAFWAPFEWFQRYHRVVTSCVYVLRLLLIVMRPRCQDEDEAEAFRMRLDVHFIQSLRQANC